MTWLLVRAVLTFAVVATLVGVLLRSLFTNRHVPLGSLVFVAILIVLLFGSHALRELALRMRRRQLLRRGVGGWVLDAQIAPSDVRLLDPETRVRRATLIALVANGANLDFWSSAQSVAPTAGLPLNHLESVTVTPRGLSFALTDSHSVGIDILGAIGGLIPTSRPRRQHLADQIGRAAAAAAAPR
ncbi:MAG: hypothetical protein ABIR17_01385 [Pseudolysinimonas sp.]|uniref:hypothetical protein n=1 Tax=Pseudolysinimonas sp. TaxID=2680009 RepID=UPI003265E8D6